MSLGKGKILMVALTLLVFVGQATASTVSACQVDVQKLTGSMAMEVTAQATTILNNDVVMYDAASKSDESGCCDQDYSCPMGGCASAALSTTSYCDGVVASSQKISQPLLLATGLSLSSVYRPPISR